MNYRIPLAGLLATVAMYVWMTIAQLSPLGMMGLSYLPADDASSAALQHATADRPGLYVVPAMPPGADAMKVYDAETRVRPSGMVIYHPAGQAPRTDASTLAWEFLKELVCCVIAAFILAEAADSIVRYAVRVALVGCIGVIVGINDNLSNLIWHGYPVAYTIAQIVMDWIGYLVAGLVLAAMIKPSTNPRPPLA